MSLTTKSTILDNESAASPTRGGIYAAGYLGILPYEAALELQQHLVQARSKGVIPDTVLLLQHPSVFTIGRFRGEADITVTPRQLTQKKIDIVHTNRGGSVTYHGPGQLIAYPILDLKANHIGVRDYIWKLEEVVIRLLSALSIEGIRHASYPAGVWVDNNKICSIGIHVSRHITMHGLALNVNTDLRYFDYINPCGMPGNVMTSISQLLGYRVEPEAIIDTFLDSFSDTFGLKHEERLKKCLDIPDDRSG